MDPGSPLIHGQTPREIFTAWVEEALAETRPPPSGLAAAYLVDLLTGRMRACGPEPPTLAEAWLTARGAEGAARAPRLRAVGDHALFVAGFFGESLTRKVVGLEYYRDIGQAAYVDLSRWLGSQGTGGGGGARDGTWGGLYRELALRFADCIEVLAVVSERVRSDGVRDVLQLYERWLATGSEPVRRRLASLGCVVGPGHRRRLQ